MIDAHRLIFTLSVLCVLREVKNHRSRPSRPCYVKSTAHSPRYILRTSNLISPLGNRLGNADKVNFLEGICAKRSNAYLTGNDDNRRRVHHGISHAGKRVRSSRATSNNAYTDLAAYPGISFCRMSSSLLMTDKYMFEQIIVTTGIFVYRVINRHNSPARVTEYSVYSFIMERTH